MRQPKCSELRLIHIAGLKRTKIAIDAKVEFNRSERNTQPEWQKYCQFQ